MALPRRGSFYQRLWNSFAEWYKDLAGYRKLGERSAGVELSGGLYLKFRAQKRRSVDGRRSGCY